jgi:hypothetical protein
LNKYIQLYILHLSAQTGPGIPHELLRQLPKIPKIPSSSGGGGTMGPPPHPPPDAKKKNDNNSNSQKAVTVVEEAGQDNSKERFLFLQ